MKKALFFLILILAGGCLAPEALDEKFFSVEKTVYQSNGILELNGSYRRSSWGIKEIRGKVSGDAIELSGTVEFWGGDKAIAHQIRIPGRINKVRLGDKVLWSREVKKVPEKKENLPAAPAVVPAPVKVITHLKSGGNDIGRLNVEFADFFTAFWGKPVQKVSSAGDSVKVIGKDEAAVTDIKYLNDHPDLEVLEIKGSASCRNIDFTGLSLPKLKKLVLDNVEAVNLDKALIPSLEEFYLSDLRYVPVGKVSLPDKLPKLHTAAIQSFAGNFNFASLCGKPVKKLWINGDCIDFEFLKDMPVEELKLTGFRGFAGKLDVLRQLPLKKLRLTPLRMADWSFLAGLKLQLLDIKFAGDSNFTPELLKDMPLEVLRMTTSYRNYGDRWLACSKLPLKEFVLRGGVVPEKFLRQSRVERVALFHCYWISPNPLIVMRMVPELKHLAMWRIFRIDNGKKSNPLDDRLVWHRFGSWKLESLCLSASDISFVRFMPHLKRLAVRGKVKKVYPLTVLRNREFDILRLPQSAAVPANCRIKYPECIDIPVSEW